LEFNFDMGDTRILLCVVLGLGRVSPTILKKKENKMSLEYINKTYSVQAKEGGRIKYTYPKPAKVGTIKRGLDGQYLEVLFDGEKRPVRLHPTWEIEYL